MCICEMCISKSDYPSRDPPRGVWEYENRPSFRSGIGENGKYRPGIREKDFVRDLGKDESIVREFGKIEIFVRKVVKTISFVFFGSGFREFGKIKISFGPPSNRPDHTIPRQLTNRIFSGFFGGAGGIRANRAMPIRRDA